MSARRRPNNQYTGDDVDYTSHDPAVVIYKIGVYGWRKRCLYFLILLILILAVINLALTIWIMRVQDFSLNGMGKLVITENGVVLDGPADFVKAMRARYIATRKDAGLQVQSMQNISVTARNGSGDITGQLVLTNNDIVMKNKRLYFLDETGKQILYADKDRLELNVNDMDFDVPGGLSFKNSIQTPKVEAGPYETLTLESLTKTLHINAAQEIKMDASASRIKSTSLYDTKFTSTKGKVVLDAPVIQLKGIKASDPTGTVQNYPQAREVCMCADGTLYLAPADAANSCKLTSGVCN